MAFDLKNKPWGGAGDLSTRLAEWAPAVRSCGVDLGPFAQIADDMQEASAKLASQDALLREAVEHIRSLTSLERVVAPDMGGKRRPYAMMQNGTILADTLDEARAFLTKMDGGR